jgi:endonuclease/exonuclease/phosphatase family metal-dependent hydrolase
MEMKSKRLVIISLLVAAGFSFAGEVTVYSWNTGKTGGALSTSQRAQIVAMNPDVLFLQEGGTEAGVQLLTNQLSAANGGATYYYSYVAMTYPLVVVSRYPISNVEVISHTAIKKKLLKCDITVGGDTLTFYGLHANTASSVAIHQAEADQFIAEISARTGGNFTNCIVVGDFNSRSVLDGAVSATSDSTYSATGYSYPNTYSTTKFFQNGFIDAWRAWFPAPAAMIPSKIDGSNTGELIDHIMLSRDLAGILLDAGIYSDTDLTLSDHRPTFVKLSVSGAATANGGVLIDSSPRFLATAVGPSNAWVDVIFNEGVYTNSDASGALTPGNFAVKFDQHDGNGGTATGVSITNLTSRESAAVQAGDQAIRLWLSVSGTPSGAETFYVKLADGTVVYNAAGTPSRLENAGTLSMVRGNWFPLRAAGSTHPVFSASPADGDTGVDPAGSIVVTFDRPMQWRSGETLTNDLRLESLATLALAATGEDIPFSITVDETKQIFTITPGSVVETQMVYAAFAATALSDTNGLVGDDALELFVTGQGGPADADSDGLPDSWETQYFGGATNADPNATAANGINTVLQTYIAGINPTNSQSVFDIGGTLSSSQGVLEWTAVTGRVYSVYWTTNLLSGFQTLETNIVWPQQSITNSLISTQPQGFYQVKVQLAP